MTPGKPSLTTWVKVNLLPDEWPGKGLLKEVQAGDKSVLLVNVGGTFRACASTCPHAGMPLRTAHVDAAGNIVCPLHHYRFDLTRGRNTSGEGYFLKTWPVEERPDGLYIGL